MFTVATRCGLGSTTVIAPALGALEQHANAEINLLQHFDFFSSTNHRCPIITTTLVVGQTEFDLNVRSHAATTEEVDGAFGPGFDQYVTTELNLSVSIRIQFRPTLRDKHWPKHQE